MAGKLGADLAPGLLKNVLTHEALPAVTARSAVAGAPIGAVAGAAGAKPGQEARGAVQGAIVGGGTGLAVPGGTALASRGAKLGGKIVGTVVGDVARGASNLSGMTRADTQGVALKQVIDALRADKATPDQIHQIANDWLASGASKPSILDLATKLPTGGGNTRRLIMGASMTDLGSGAAGQHAEQVATALPENADRLVSALTPETRTAAQVQKALKAKPEQRGRPDVSRPLFPACADHPGNQQRPGRPARRQRCAAGDQRGHGAA